MPSEHRLTGHRLTGATAFFGKHPGHGDFIGAGLPDMVERSLSDWLGATLGEVRDSLGESWDQIQHSPVALRFWMGAALGQGQAWRGVLRMSGDKVGRRYPLLILQATGPETLPVVQVQQGFYQDAETSLSGMLEQAVLTSADMLDVLDQQLGQHVQAGAGLSDHMFWAIKQSADIEQLSNEVALTDLISAATGRSYWWFAKPTLSGILGCNGLPDAQALAWLVGGGHVSATQDGAEQPEGGSQ